MKDGLERMVTVKGKYSMGVVCNRKVTLAISFRLKCKYLLV